jgi:hypothetical protein
MTANGHKESLLYRLITKDEWEPRLTPIFQKINKFMPPAELAVASIAEDRDKIVAMVALQMVSYLGPLYIDEDYARKVDYKLLKAPIDAVYSKSMTKPLIIQGYVAMTSDEAVARIAEIAGMTRKPEAILLVQEFGDGHTIIG